MESLAVKKKKLDIQRVETAMMDLDVKCDELSEEISKLEAHIEISKSTLVKLNVELKQLVEGE